MATLSVQISEKLNINGTDRGNVTTVDIGSVTQVVERVISVGTTELSILEFDGSSAAPSAGTLVDGSVQYLRITNTASSGTCDLRVTDSANNKEYIYTIGAGESYILLNDSMDANTGSSDLGGAKAMTNIDVIKAKASTTLLLEVMAVAT